MASIKIIVSDNFRAEYSNGDWTIKATSKLAKQLFKIKGRKNGEIMESASIHGVSDEIESFEASVFKLAEISGDA